MRSRYAGVIAGLVAALLLSPGSDSPADNLRIVEVGTSVLITVVLLHTVVLYRRRARASVALTWGEYSVVIGCIVSLLTTATLVVCQRLAQPGVGLTLNLVLSVAVQPVLLWWAIRMENRLGESSG